MKTKSLAFSKIITAGLCLALSNLAFSANLTGTWRLIVEPDGGPSKKPGHGWAREWGDRLELIQTGGGVSGTYYRGEFVEARVTGTSIGSDFKLQYEYSEGHGRRQRTTSVEYSGTVENDSIQGTLVVNGGGPARGFTGFASTGGSPSELYDELPPDIQEELAKEKEGMVAGCNSNTQNRTFNDCSCVVKKYMDYRISNGSAAGGMYTIGIIDKPDTIGECINEAGVAEHYYASCVVNHSDRGEKDVEKYCRCYADSIAKDVKKQATMSDHVLRVISRTSYQACRRP